MRTALLFAVSISALLLSACRIEIENPFPDVHSYSYGSQDVWVTPGVYVDRRLVTYMEDVFPRYVPGSEKKFSDLAVEFTALAPRPEVIPGASAGAVNPKDPLPPYRPTTPWWNSVPGWQFEPPNKVAISFFFDGWELESILGAAFSAFAANHSAESAVPAGITVSDALKKRLAHLFDETKICTGYSAGEVTDLALYLMPPEFLCEVNGDQMCSGYYTPPNTVLIGDRERVSKHEFIHYILWKNTGNSDGAHASPFFQDCTQ